jgi:hypothetical protein
MRVWTGLTKLIRWTSVKLYIRRESCTTVSFSIRTVLSGVICFLVVYKANQQCRHEPEYTHTHTHTHTHIYIFGIFMMSKNI